MYQLLTGSRRKRGRFGFTLVELLVVIVVLAVLAAIVLPKFMNSSTRSKESALKSDLKLLRNAVSLFQADTGKLPNGLSDLSETDKTKVKVAGGTVVNAADWHGPYIETVPTDPVSGAAFTYDSTTGKVTSSASGNGLDGSAYSGW